MTEIPPQAVQVVAEKLYRAYDSEFGADRLSWRDFEGQARELLALAAPLFAEHLARLIEDNVRNADHAKQDRGKWLGMSCRMAYVDGHDKAAAIAREAFPKGENRG